VSDAGRNALQGLAIDAIPIVPHNQTCDSTHRRSFAC
jgi:hypothetical protein